MKPLRQIDGRDLDPSALRHQLRTSGYLLVRNVLPKFVPQQLLHEITQILHRAGWLQSAEHADDVIANATAACSNGDAAYKEIAEKVFNLESFHALPHHPALRRLMEMVVGPEVLVHPKSAARLIFPNYERAVIRAHQDHTAVAGDPETFTAWMPFHDCPEMIGPLSILEGSHLLGMQSTVGDTGYISAGTVRGCEWAVGQINAGDVLLFHSMTVHQAMPNRSTQLRISLDCRFQSYLRPVNPAALVFTGSGKRCWEDTYRDWKSEELQFYWTQLPLRLKPSRQELVALAHNAEPLRMRERYARILERIDATGWRWAS